MISIMLTASNDRNQKVAKPLSTATLSVPREQRFCHQGGGKEKKGEKKEREGGKKGAPQVVAVPLIILACELLSAIRYPLLTTRGGGGEEEKGKGGREGGKG